MPSVCLWSVLDVCNMVAAPSWGPLQLRSCALKGVTLLAIFDAFKMMEEMFKMNVHLLQSKLIVDMMTPNKRLPNTLPVCCSKALQSHKHCNLHNWTNWAVKFEGDFCLWKYKGRSFRVAGPCVVWVGLGNICSAGIWPQRCPRSFLLQSWQLTGSWLYVIRTLFFWLVFAHDIGHLGRTCRWFGLVLAADIWLILLPSCLLLPCCI